VGGGLNDNFDKFLWGPGNLTPALPLIHNVTDTAHGRQKLVMAVCENIIVFKINESSSDNFKNHSLWYFVKKHHEVLTFFVPINCWVCKCVCLKWQKLTMGLQTMYVIEEDLLCQNLY
jgi:hypothetical protein